MNILQSGAMLAPWLLWLLYWLATANDTKKTLIREGSLSRSLQNFIVGAGVLLILLPDFSRQAFIVDTQVFGAQQQAGLAVTIAGLLVSVWARVHLGRNWSAAVTLKENHELIRSGPYAWVRHPIYTGCLLALFGNALINGEPRGYIGVAIVFFALVYKVRLEERGLSQYFGESHVSYCRDVSALIPGVY
ncbi:MAG: isoprenylcysteine carboxyl methyltransferase [Verrucomicrobiaceae bacterium]|nr:isoprenylcysteine carboxyl methyltransferase [Verrucomicrobiaceae bacterium]